MFRAAKKDGNHNEILREFLARGFSVAEVYQLKEMCDMFVAKHGVTFAIEVKDGRRIPSERRLTDGEQKFRDGWKGHYALIERVSDVEEVEKKIRLTLQGSTR